MTKKYLTKKIIKIVTNVRVPFKNDIVSSDTRIDLKSEVSSNYYLSLNFKFGTFSIFAFWVGSKICLGKLFHENFGFFIFFKCFLLILHAANYFCFCPFWDLFNLLNFRGVNCYLIVSSNGEGHCLL